MNLKTSIKMDSTIEAKMYLQSLGINDHISNSSDLPEFHKRTSKLMTEFAKLKVEQFKNTGPMVYWTKFDFDKIETRPTKTGKYFVCRKDGKVHWETWNGSGWAYNHNEIRYYAVIKSPIEQSK